MKKQALNLKKTKEDFTMKSIFASKTFWVNALTSVISMGTYLVDSSIFTDNPEFVAIAGTIIGALNVALRLITKEPVSIKKIEEVK